MPQALGKDKKTLGKGFTECYAECNTRQTAHGIYSVGKQIFGECFLSRTRQMVYRVSNLTLGKKSGLPSVLQNTLSKGLLFVECFWELHSANLFFKEKIIIFFSAYFSLIAAIQNTLSTPYLHAHHICMHITT